MTRAARLATDVGKHRLGDQRGLDDLRLRQRCGDAHERFVREHGCPLVYRPDVAGEAEAGKVVVEEGAWKIREGWHGPEEIDLLPGEAKRLEKVERLLESCGDQEVTRRREAAARRDRTWRDPTVRRRNSRRSSSVRRDQLKAPRGVIGSRASASARCAAKYPHMPCTPTPGGVAAEQM